MEEVIIPQIYPDANVLPHTHNGIDSPLIDKGSQPFSRPKTATFVIGPKGNSDSSTYDYVTDGTNDDVEIQAAIDALPSNGGSICFREGTYTLGSASVSIAKNGVTLFGMGKGTIITCKTNFNKVFFKLGHASSQYYHTVVQDFYIDGNQAHQSSGTYTIDNFSLAKPIINVEYSGCFIINSSNSAINNSYGATVSTQEIIHNCYFQDWASPNYALTISNFTKVTNNYFINSDTGAKYLTGSGIITGNEFSLPASFNTTAINAPYLFTNNYITAGASVGSSCILINSGLIVKSNNIVFGASANVGSVAISACQNIEGNIIDGAGNAIAATVDCRVAGNKITNNRGHTINVTTGGVSNAFANIHNNYLAGGGESVDDTYYQIYIQSGEASNIVMGNVLITGAAVNKPKYGIYDNNAGYKNIILGNVVRGAKSGQIVVNGTSDDVSHNVTS